MSMKLVFLGTSCSNPTVERNLSATALRFNGQWLLFDCPEGTQRQLMKAKVSYSKIQHIFLSHVHADHFLGLPGLIATNSMHARDYPLYIYGPKGTCERVKRAINLGLMKTSFEIQCREIRRGRVLETETYRIDAVPLKHDVPCLGYVFKEKDKEGEFQRAKAEKLGIAEGPLWSQLQKGKTVKHKGKSFKPEQVMDYNKGRKGKKVSIVMDTLPNESYYDAIMDSDVLVHESSFLEKHVSRAKETKHSTAMQAADVAAKTNVKQLVLTHISPRYKKASEIENEARQVFGNVAVAKDLMELEV